VPRCLGPADGVPSLGSVQALVEDRAGNLWIGGDTTLLRRSANSYTAYRPTGLQNNAGIAGIAAIAEAPDGTLWVGISKPGPDLGLQRLVDGRLEAFRTSQLDGSTLSVSALYLDREGSLWIGTLDRGLYRVRGDAVAHFDRRDGLSGDFVVEVTEDREGSIWVATSQGVDRFSDTPVVSFSSGEGLCSPEAASVLATRDGSIWTGGDGALTRVRGSTVSCLRSGRELPGSQVTSLFADRAGRLWVGLDDGLWVYEQERFRQVRRPDGRAIGLVTSIAEAANGQVWIAVSGPPRILVRIEGLTVREDYHDAPLPRRVAADPTGGLWLGLLAGDLARLHDGTLQTFRFAHDDSAFLHQLLPLADGSVLAATSYGLIGWLAGRQATLTVKNGLPCDAVHAIAFDRQDDLWLFLSCGLTEVTNADLQRWKTDPGARVSPRVLDELDGVRVGRASFEAGARSTNGHLWFANGLQLQTIDPARLRRNTVPPPVHIERIVADRTSYPASAVVRLPPLTRDIEIAYAGLSFVAPQKVSFRYRLVGRDDTWQEPGTRREAFYSDLRPGTYRFRVIASNNDGVWNEDGASLDFVIAPAWYQTSWFLALSLVAAGAAALAAYQLRLRQVAAALNARFDERLAERTRVARDLHDTLLQTVQGTKMVADNALDRPDDAAGMRRAMEQVSSWLGQASHEGRAAVNALRTSATERNDLAEALRRAIDDCARPNAMEAELSVTGEARDMHPIVRDEVYRIAYEAIRNASVHSGGRRLEVSLNYSQDLTVRVADNGVGMEPAIAETGKSGHFGLRGMRERAARIGARLAIESTTAGTEVVLIVPGRVIFRKPTATIRERLAAVLTSLPIRK
jgi:signal transduction histidine kinase